MAEIELSVLLARQCLEQRIPDRETLTGELGARGKRSATLPRKLH
jgi:hypothetical protein